MARKNDVSETYSGSVAGGSARPVTSLPVKTGIRAFDLLAQQPVSLIGLTQDERDQVVVTAVVDDGGGEHVLSRFGDEIWDLSPEIQAHNRSHTARKIEWPTDVPKALVDDAKAAMYCSLRQGRGGMDWAASSAVNVGQKIAVTLRYFASVGIERFDQIRSLYITDYISKLKKSSGPSTIRLRLAIVDMVWSFEKEMIYSIVEHPFGGKSLNDAVGCRQDQNDLAGRSGKTPVIPPSVQGTLWETAEKVMGTAKELLDKRDLGRIGAFGKRLALIRNAVLYQLQITSGMRNSESTGVTNNCWRSEERTLRDGKSVTFHWVRTREVKTTGGKEMDYLVPRELFLSLEILQRYAEPFQRRLADEGKWLEMMLVDRVADGRLRNGMTISHAVQRLNYVRQIGQNLFLTISHAASDHLGTGSRVEVQSIGSCNKALKILARMADVRWKLANHQCRRTFAWNVANSRLGRMGLVFLKWQLKHASISWTQLYAANPNQDQALYQEFGDVMWESKVGLIASWQAADVRLSGGAGKKLMQTRATPVKNFRQLLEATADSVNLLSTGHAWCMSGTHGCHGQGIYDPAMCGGCSGAIIDESHASRWQMIHLDNLRLAAITDCGPTVEAKVKRAVAISNQVLMDLRVPLPTLEQSNAYEIGTWVE